MKLELSTGNAGIYVKVAFDTGNKDDMRVAEILADVLPHAPWVVEIEMHTYGDGDGDTISLWRHKKGWRGLIASYRWYGDNSVDDRDFMRDYNTEGVVKILRTGRWRSSR